MLRIRFVWETSNIHIADWTVPSIQILDPDQRADEPAAAPHHRGQAGADPGPAGGLRHGPGRRARGQAPRPAAVRRHPLQPRHRRPGAVSGQQCLPLHEAHSAGESAPSYSINNIEF